MSEEEMNSDLADVKRDVALLNQFNLEVVKPALERMSNSIARLDVISRSEFEEYKRNVARDLTENYVKQDDHKVLQARVSILIAAMGVIGTGALIWATNQIFMLISGH